MVDPLAYLSKLSVPFGVITTIIGGSAWLTTTHTKVEMIEKQFTVFAAEYSEEKGKILDKVNDQESKLSRIEGKLDILIETIRRRRNETDGSNSGSSHGH